MSSFIPANPATGTDEQIANNGFFPPLSLAQFKADYRLEGNIADSRIKAALTFAMIDSNRLLASWQASYIASGYLTLDEISAQQYGDHTELYIAYLRAVSHRACAQLLDDYRNYDSTGEGHDRADELTAKADDHRAQAHSALASLSGESSTLIELI